VEEQGRESGNPIKKRVKRSRDDDLWEAAVDGSSDEDESEVKLAVDGAGVKARGARLLGETMEEMYPKLEEELIDFDELLVRTIALN
jgi:hypothetical protein